MPIPTSMPRQTNATTTKATSCTKCRRNLPAGVRVALFQLRPVTLKERTGQVSTLRRWCPRCLGKAIAQYDRMSEGEGR